MTLLNTINVGGTNYGITGAAVIGACSTPAGSEVKVCTFSDNFELKAGDMLLVKFTYANTYGDGSTTYPKLQVNGTNYVMRRADGNYVESGEWNNNATLTFLFDGTDFILPAGSSSESGGGVPLGTILAIHSNQVPDGFLPCNGVQFDTTQFSALYALLGDDHTPDLREVTLRGIGRNGTYVFDSTETDPSTGQAGTQNHDEYTLGEFKDDQLQDHKHKYGWKDDPAPSATVEAMDAASNLTWVGLPSMAAGNGGSPKFQIKGVYDGRVGTVTRGKSVGVNYIIKATSGLPDDQQDYILNTLNAQRSYSTTEQPTGKKWIDGKDIYERTFTYDNIAVTAGQYNTVDSQFPIPFSQIKKAQSILVASDFTMDCLWTVEGTEFKIYENMSGSTGTVLFTLEYTKTTPST